MVCRALYRNLHSGAWCNHRKPSTRTANFIALVITPGGSRNALGNGFDGPGSAHSSLNARRRREEWPEPDARMRDARDVPAHPHAGAHYVEPDAVYQPRLRRVALISRHLGLMLFHASASSCRASPGPHRNRQMLFAAKDEGR